MSVPSPRGSSPWLLRAKPGTSLDTLENECRALLARLADEGVDAEQLRRAQSRYEANEVRRLETVSQRTSRLAHYNTFLGTPDFAAQDVARHLAVDPGDIERVLERYLVG